MLFSAGGPKFEVTSLESIRSCFISLLPAYFIILSDAVTITIITPVTTDWRTWYYISTI